MVRVLQTTPNLVISRYNARAQLLFCTLKLLFGDVLVAVAVVLCVRSLMVCANPRPGQYLTHAHSSGTRALAAMDSCFGHVRPSKAWHSRRVADIRELKKPRHRRCIDNVD